MHPVVAVVVVVRIDEVRRHGLSITEVATAHSISLVSFDHFNIFINQRLSGLHRCPMLHFRSYSN